MQKHAPDETLERGGLPDVDSRRVEPKAYDGGRDFGRRPESAGREGQDRLNVRREPYLDAEHAVVAMARLGE